MRKGAQSSYQVSATIPDPRTDIPSGTGHRHTSLQEVKGGFGYYSMSCHERGSLDRMA